MTQKHSFNIIFVALGLVLILLSREVTKKYDKPKLNLTINDTAYTVNKDFIRLFSLGNYRALSSLLWTHTLLMSDLKHVKEGEGSWMFDRFITIAHLSPKFYENYLWGGLYLSVVKDDPKNAQIIYDLGTEVYPDDYRLLWYGGYNAYLELKDYNKALKNLKKIESVYGSKKFPMINLVISRIEAKGNSIETAISILERAISLEKNERIKNILKVELEILLEKKNNQITN